MTDGVIVLDKPGGITSFRAVEEVGRVLRTKKCGHAGTLDPMATGVLLVCAGRATKIAGYLAAQEKEYEARFRFGAATDTGDVTGKVIESRPAAFAPSDAVAVAVSGLVGTREQVPPAFSAVKVAGTRAYVMARQGKPLELSPRTVTVAEARLLSWSEEGFAVFLRCSKGFYVRALPRELGRLLGVPMAVSSLRRLRSGTFRVEDSVTLADLVEEGKRGAAASRLVPIEKALAGFPQWEIPKEAVVAVRHGGSPAPWLAGRDPGPSQGVVLLTHGKEGPVALVERIGEGRWRIVRGI
ncbi:MAG: tRNA pseudouridine(55) synthase TruB [Deltaproteobacteria bacterium RBG_16_64_85]|nr:MAG: tRNA pseudouridine(55) synthase TruB [Deltaproteobacteria bacterium RBG_16_64_85]